jgi:poly-gamma-glutamate synthesis protein (capsule biosynthesis protein)
MKISYRVEKKELSKNQPLEGIRKANTPTPEQMIKHKEARLRRFDPTRVALSVVFLFILEVLLAYIFNVPTVRWSIDYLRQPNKPIASVSYNTIKVKLADELPETLKNELKVKLSDIAYNGTKRFEFVTENPDLTLTYTTNVVEQDQKLADLFLVPVGHLYWIRDTVSKGNLQQDEILVPKGMKALYSTIIATYTGKEPKLKEVSDVTAALKSQEKNVGFVDFTNLGGSYKLLTMDGKKFFENSPEGGIPYYLVLTGNSKIGKSVIQARAGIVFPESFDKNSILTVRMTGVTAITRGLGIKTNASGDPAYAAKKIGDFLSKADLTHVSNEISMVKGCVPSGGVSFCMVPTHIEALKKSGVDIVELTGNHNNDKGSTYNTSTINTYKSLGWDYFGGGLNSTDAAKILYKEVKGTKVAFLGYNYYDTVQGTGAIAGKSKAGANSWSASKISKDVAEARKNKADVVIVDFQYQECWSYTDNGSTVAACYGPIGSPNQKKDFRQAVDAGADIVIGAQAHQPQTYEIYKGKVIFYGLGNLYFDQTQQLGTRQGLILTHYMYKGKYLGTGITTTIYDGDLLTYITTGSQRTSLLKSLQSGRPKN